ncbi:hypothetical protein LXA43DRAFT_1064246 [Ganoderma leucocontextum]|nr:hypothetical protein LXA43DRAFT_1064246 [Ganoderma leucocontextum]
MSPEGTVEMSLQERLLRVGDRAYSVWKHRPPVDHPARIDYQREIQTQMQDIVPLAVQARSTGPILVSPFVSACLVEATALAQDTRARTLDLENLDPSRAVVSDLYPIMEDHKYGNIDGWWSKREGPRQMVMQPATTPSHHAAQAPAPPPLVPATVVPGSKEPKGRTRRSAHRSEFDTGATPTRASTPSISTAAVPATPSSTVPLAKFGPPRGTKKIKIKVVAAPPPPQSVPGPPMTARGASHRQSDAVPSALPAKAALSHSDKKARDKAKKALVLEDAQGKVPNREMAAIPDTSDAAKPETAFAWPKNLMPDDWDPVGEQLPLGWVPTPVRCRNCVKHDVVCRINLATSATLVPGGKKSTSKRKVAIAQRLYILFEWCLTASESSVHPKERAVPVDDLLGTVVPAWFQSARERCLNIYETYGMKTDSDTTAQGTGKRNRVLVPSPNDEHGPRPVQIDSRAFKKRGRDWAETEEDAEDEGAEESDMDEEKVRPTKPPVKRPRTTGGSEAALKTTSKSKQKSSPAEGNVDDPSPRFSAKAKGKRKAGLVQAEETSSRAEEEEKVGGQPTIIGAEPQRKLVPSDSYDYDVPLAGTVLGKAVKSVLRPPPVNRPYVPIPSPRRTFRSAALLAKAPELPQVPKALEVPQALQVSEESSAFGDNMQDLPFASRFSSVPDYDNMHFDANQGLSPAPAAPSSPAPEALEENSLSGVPHSLPTPVEYRLVRPEFDHSAIASTINWNFDQSHIHAGQLGDAMSQVGQRGTQLGSRVAESETALGELRSQNSGLQQRLYLQNLLCMAQDKEITQLRQRVKCLEAYLLERVDAAAGTGTGIRQATPDVSKSSSTSRIGSVRSRPGSQEAAPAAGPSGVYESRPGTVIPEVWDDSRVRSRDVSFGSDED